MKTGDVIKQLRQARGLTQSRLAEKLGKNRQYVHYIENTADCQFSTVQQVADVLGFTMMAFPKEALQVEPVRFENE